MQNIVFKNLDIFFEDTCIESNCHREENTAYPQRQASPSHPPLLPPPSSLSLFQPLSRELLHQLGNTRSRKPHLVGCEPPCEHPYHQNHILALTGSVNTADTHMFQIGFGSSGGLRDGWSGSPTHLLLLFTFKSGRDPV